MMGRWFLIFSLIFVSAGPTLAKPAKVDKKRSPSAYLPRYDEMKSDLLSFEQKIEGIQQDILDFRKFDLKLRKLLSDYRRLNPHGPSSAEERLMEFYNSLKPSFDFFRDELKPKAQDCRKVIEKIHARDQKRTPSTFLSADAEIAVRLTEKLCRLR